MAKLDFNDHFEASIEWLGNKGLLPGRQYCLRRDNETSEATITKLKYRLGHNEQQHVANRLNNGESGVVNIALSKNLSTDIDSGDSFVLLDLKSGEELGRGQVNHQLRRATNIRWQALDINKAARASLKNQNPCVVWLTGFSGSGKSTIANLVEKKLHDLQMHSYILDGDNVRHGLNKDLGFTDADRVENIRRIAETAKLMVDAGLVVITSFISPFRAERQMARDLLDEGEFVEVFVDTPLDVCEDRDPKGLYQKVRAGQIKNFTGFDSPYEPPENPELRFDTTKTSADKAAQEIVYYLQRRLA